MEVTAATWIIALAGLGLIVVLSAFQLVAAVRPRAQWTIDNVYGGSPSDSDPVAYFAFNQGWAWADPFYWAPLQIAGSIGMMAGHRWGFLLALMGSVPFWYSAIPLYIWDRDLGFRRDTVGYWISWGIWPVFGVIEGAYCLIRLLG
jgi:hypothetical protein